MACARFNFEWDNQFKLSLDPQRAIEYFCASNPDLTPEQRDHCSMCGAKLCAIKSSRALGGRGSGGGA